MNKHNLIQLIFTTESVIFLLWNGEHSFALNLIIKFYVLGYCTNSQFLYEIGHKFISTDWFVPDLHLMVFILIRNCSISALNCLPIWRNCILFSLINPNHYLHFLYFILVHASNPFRCQSIAHILTQPYNVIGLCPSHTSYWSGEEFLTNKFKQNCTLNHIIVVNNYTFHILCFVYSSINEIG